MIEYDPLLVTRARDGGPDLEALVRAIWPEAYRVAYGVLRDRELAEDCAQDACVAIVRSLSTLHEVTAFRSWMYRTVMNHAISLGRRERRRVTQAAGESIALDRADLLDLERAIAALPLEQRAVIILHYYAGLTSSEIAGMSSLQSSTIRFRLMLARRALRKHLEAADADATRSSEGVSHA